MAKDLTSAWAALSQDAAGSTSRKDRVLPAAQSKSAIPARTGTAQPGGSATGSIASPLTEANYAARTWWPDQTITSSDGIFTIKLKPIKKVSFTDANDALVELIFAEPT